MLERAPAAARRCGTACGGGAPEGSTGPTTASPATVAEGEQQHHGSPRYLPWVAFGVGAAGLILGGVTGGLAMGAHSTLAGECPGGTCPTDKQSDLDSYHLLGTLSTVGFAVGGVGVAAGVVLLLVQPKSDAAPPAAASSGLSVTPVLGPGSIGAVGRF
jgi:hypothetical protein